MWVTEVPLPGVGAGTAVCRHCNGASEENFLNALMEIYSLHSLPQEQEQE